MSFKKNLIISALFSVIAINVANATNSSNSSSKDESYKEITSADIVKDIAELMGVNEDSCLEYKVEGICIWITPTPWGIKIDESIKVRHFVPEVVISTYDNMGENPWKEVKTINEKALKANFEVNGVGIAGEHAGFHQKIVAKNRTNTTPMKRKNGDAFGSPNLITFIALNNSTPAYFCKPQTKPYVPYYLSGLDFISWGGLSLVATIPELAAGISDPDVYKGLMIGQRELGNFENPRLDQWGNIYPRTGVVNQIHDYKAGALIAQRIADFMTREWQFHILPMGSLAKKEEGTGTWYPPKIIENTKDNHKWRMLSPQLEKKCHLFGNAETDATYQDKISKKGNYSWELWRPYSCCERKGAELLTVIDFKQ